MKILVPTDFSPNAAQALAFAKQLAHKEKASITLLYAFYAVYDFASQATEIIAQIEADAKKALKKEVKHGEEEGLTIDYKLQHGTVSTTITSIAYKEDYDLIIMGTQGASGIKKALVGSNTGHAIKESMVPVLAVPGKSDFSNLEKITVCLELRKEDPKYFSTLFHLTENLGLPYEFIHFSKEMSFEEVIEFKGLEVYLKSQFPNLTMNFIHKEQSSLEEGIKHYVPDNKNMMLVMFSKQKSFFEYLFNQSSSLQMAYHTHVPLLVIK